MLATSGLFFKEYINIITNVSNTLITIGISTYITFNISKKSFQKDALDQQKIIALNSIDHSSLNSVHVLKLIDRITQIKSKKDIKSEQFFLQFLEEIIFSLSQINGSIISSQNDLRRLVKDEIEQDNKILIEINRKYDEIKEKIDKINETAMSIVTLQENGESTAQKIDTLKSDMSKLKREYLDFVSKTNEESSFLRLYKAPSNRLVSTPIPLTNVYDEHLVHTINPSNLTHFNNNILSSLDFYIDDDGNIKKKDNK